MKKRNYWPLFFIGIFSFVFSMIIWTIMSAVSVPVIEDRSFMKKYQDVDENYNNMMDSNSLFLSKYDFEFYVNDKKEIVGTHYRPTQKSLDSLKEELSKRTINNITFIDIHEVFHQGERVLLFEIPATPRGIPMSFDGHYYENIIKNRY